MKNQSVSSDAANLNNKILNNIDREILHFLKSELSGYNSSTPDYLQNNDVADPELYTSRLINCVTNIELLDDWEAISNIYPNNKALSHSYFITCVSEAIKFSQQENIHSQNQALEWMDEIKRTLAKMQKLIDSTPSQFQDWETKFSFNRVTQLESSMEGLLNAGHVSKEANLWAEKMVASSCVSQDARKLNTAMLLALEDTQFNQGPTPARPNHKNSEMRAFSNFLSCSISPYIEDWHIVVAKFCREVFLEEMRPSQVKRLGVSISPKHGLSKREFEFSIPVNLIPELEKFYRDK